MKTLTLMQRAKRAASRKNNKIAKDYPLFAKEFAVTVENQMERLQRQQRVAEDNLDGMRKWEIAEYEKAMQIREICKANMPTDIFADFDARAHRIYGMRGKWSLPEYAGANYADWWWGCVRDYVPSYAQNHCPNSQFHDWEIYQRDGKCPTCKKILTLTKVGPVASQLALPTFGNQCVTTG